MERLKDRPTSSLRALADELHVDRHTVTRALHRELGLSFRMAQAVALTDRLSLARRERQQRSLKELAHLVGYSSGRALSRRLRKS
jgi:AraC-like DNA-binding protein